MVPSVGRAARRPAKAGRCVVYGRRGTACGPCKSAPCDEMRARMGLTGGAPASTGRCVLARSCGSGLHYPTRRVASENERKTPIFATESRPLHILGRVRRSPLPDFRCGPERCRAVPCPSSASFASCLGRQGASSGLLRSAGCSGRRSVDVGKRHGDGWGRGGGRANGAG